MVPLLQMILIHKSDKFVGTGHSSEIVTDNEGNDWIFYHAFKVTDPDGRVLMLDKVDWQNDWPYINEEIPSTTSVCPAF